MRRLCSLWTATARLVDGWLERGVAALNERPDVGVVCGHVREMHPEASVYNRLFDLEWRQGPGESERVRRHLHGEARGVQRSGRIQARCDCR
jgi:hypothetical protein